MYNAASDGVDSTITAGVTAPVPELTFIAMILMGITVILGYVRNNEGGRKVRRGLTFLFFNSSQIISSRVNIRV